MSYHPSKLEVPLKEVLISEKRNSSGLVEKIVLVSPIEAAKAIANMDYNSQREFFDKYTLEIKAQEEADRNKGRAQLPTMLKSVAHYSSKVSHSLSHAWGLCERYMSKTKGGYRGT
jgi:hypothetical protein